MSSGASSAPRSSIPPLGKSESVDELWPSLEKYLADGLVVLRTGTGEEQERLRSLRCRMEWYFRIYNLCSGSFDSSYDVYRRLSTFLLNDLEVNVLRPLLRVRGDSASERLCLSFLHQYDVFMLFRRVVLSCFSYLDQYYTKKYHIDSITVLCVKMFYLVVYEPLRERVAMDLVALANEERVRMLSLPSVVATAAPRAVGNTQRMLTSLGEFLSEVKAHSQLPPPAEGGEQKRVTLERIAQQTRGLRRTSNDVATDSAVSPPASLSIQVCEGPGGADEKKRAGITEGALERIRQVRESLEHRSFGDLISGELGNKNVNLSHPTVVDLLPPLHIVLFADFGLLYVKRAEVFYRSKRAVQLSVHQCRGYLEWARRILDYESSLARNIGEPHFHRILCVQLGHALLVEPHRQIVLDEEVGFFTLLEAFVGRHATVPSANRVASHWESLSQSELATRLTQFFRAFVSQQDEACGVLLASEFASKVVLDTAELFIAYMTGMGSATAAHTRPSHPQGDVQSECAMSLIAALEEIVGVYEEIVRHQFDNSPSMHAALSDALHEMVNSEHWDTSAPRRVAAAVSAAASGLPNILLNHDAAKRILPALANLAALRGAAELLIPHMLAAYCDRLCRRSDGDDVAGRVGRVVFLVQLLDDKDVFLEQYRLLLARRLLSTPASQVRVEVERMILHKLLHALGRTVAYSLDAMLRDYENSSNAAEVFAQSDAYSEMPAKMRVHVLTATHWPVYRVLRITPCASLLSCMNTFTHHYIGLHPSRTLRWIHSLGTALLYAVFPRGTKEIIANTVQATILILTSEACALGRGISGAAVADLMGMSFAELRVHLDLLVAHHMYGLLRRCSGGNASGPLGPEEELTLNEEYAHKLRKFRLPVVRSQPPAAARGDDECGVAAVSKAIDETRRLQVDAAIIRIMKSHRSLKYYELMEGTTRQLSRLFIPMPRLIKAQVEDLVGRGFLRRSEENASVFEYIA